MPRVINSPSHETASTSPKHSSPTPATDNHSDIEAPSEFCLRWNNYQLNLLSVFEQLLEKQLFVDVTLCCEGGYSVKAHKIVLSACSPYFQALFNDTPCDHPILILKDVQWPDLKSILSFMYKGEIHVSQDQISPLLKLAELLKIRGLSEEQSDGREVLSHKVNEVPNETKLTKSPIPAKIDIEGKKRTSKSDSLESTAKRIKVEETNQPEDESITSEENAKLMENSHAWLGASTSASIADSYQYQLQSMWQKCWNTNQNLIHHLRFRERCPLKSWRPETMAEAIFSVLKDGLSLSQAARKYDIPYPTFVLHANRVHNMLGPSIDGGTDLRLKGRGRPQRILLGIWPDEHNKGVIKTVVFRDAKEFKEDGMHLNYGRHSPVHPFPTDGQMSFPGSQCTNGPNSQTQGSGTESLSPEAAAAVAAVVGLRQQMQMAAAAHHTENFNFPAHCANIHSNNGGSAGFMPMPNLGSPAASGQMGGNNGGSGVQIPRLASPAMPGLSNNNIPHNLAGIPGLDIMQSMMSGQPSQSGITISPAHHGGSNTHSSSINQSHSNSHGHHITSTTTLNSGSLNISRITPPANSAHDLRMTSSDDENPLHSPLDIDMESGVNLAVSGMAYKSSRSYSSPRPEHIFADELNDFVNAPTRCPSRMSGFKEPAGGIKLEPMTECRGE